jgi:hypothetical protein
VIAVADTFDAVTTNRPYQKAHEAKDALRIIQNLSGQRLDPRAVDALLAVYERGEIRLPKTPAPLTASAEPAPASTAAAAASSPADPLTIESMRI